MPFAEEGLRGPPDSRDSTLLFERQTDGSYRMRLGTPAQVQAWKARSRRQGTLFAMRGGRAWGVFS